MTHSKSENKRFPKNAPQLRDLHNIPTHLQARSHVLVLMLDVQQGHSLQHHLDDRFKTLSSVERGFALELLMGSLRHFTPLHLLIKSMISKPLKKNARWLETLLVMGAYEFLYMSTPSRAVIHSLVELVKVLGFDHLSGLTNAVLRQLQRNTEDNKKRIETMPIHEYLGEGHWLHAQLFKDWKPFFLDILKGFQAIPSMFIRVNSKKISPSDYFLQLSEAGFETVPPHEIEYPVPVCIELARTAKVTELPGYHDGLMSIQDFSAQLAVQMLVDLVQPTDEAASLKVLDACAAPGGKTAALIDLLPDNTEFHVVEIDPKRITRIEENLTRQGLLSEKVSIICADLTKENELVDQSGLQAGYDVILLDAPCSGTGVIGRHPDIFWLRQESDIANLVATQRQLLARADELLRPGGLLMYATCSILKDENSHNIEWYLNNNATQLEAVTMDERLGLQQAYGNQRLPLSGSSGDGFYYALLRKPE